MPITLEPKLQTKLDETAERLGKSVDEIADEAIRRRLSELDAQTLDDEAAAYHRLYPELRQQFPNQYVAIYEGRVVDADAEFEELYLRIKAQFGERAVYIRQVSENIDEEYRFRSPRLDERI